MTLEDHLTQLRSPYGDVLDVGDSRFLIDAGYFRQHRKEIERLVAALPMDGIGWSLLSSHLGGNGGMAQMLIGLGDAAGWWKMTPPNGSALWGTSRLYPMVLSGSVRLQKPEEPEVVAIYDACDTCGAAVPAGSEKKCGACDAEEREAKRRKPAPEDPGPAPVKDMKWVEDLF